MVATSLVTKQKFNNPTARIKSESAKPNNNYCRMVKNRINYTNLILMPVDWKLTVFSNRVYTRTFPNDLCVSFSRVVRVRRREPGGFDQLKRFSRDLLGTLVVARLHSGAFCIIIIFSLSDLLYASQTVKQARIKTDIAVACDSKPRSKMFKSWQRRRVRVIKIVRE